MADAGAAGGGAGGGATQGFISTLPAELQAEPSLQNFKDVGTLAKSYVSAQKMIGQNRVAIPQETWGESEWNGLFDQIGRPKTADDYKVPGFEFKSGAKLDDAKMKAAKAALHGAGLNQRQFDSVMKYYFQSVDGDITSATAAQAAARAASENQLRSTWGDSFESNVALAKSVVNKFGDADFIKEMESSGLGNNPKLIQVLHNIGKAMLEDHSRGGTAADQMHITDQSRAQQEIGKLKQDDVFMKKYLNRNEVGHKEAVEHMRKLFEVGFPGKQK